MNIKYWSAGMIIPLAAAAVVSTASAAPAAGVAAPPDPFDRAFGSCTGLSDATLNARTTFRDRIALEFNLTSNRPGQAWRVRITQNGAPIAAQTAFTRPTRDGFRFPRRSASLTVREVTRDTRGLDRFTANAINVRTGETCTARAQVRPDREFDRPFRPVPPPFRP